MSKYVHKMELTERPDLSKIGLEPLIDMAFAADLIGMTYDQFKNWLYRNKWRFPPRYRVVHYRDVGGYRRVTKIRVLYPYEVKLIREINLRGTGSTIHTRADLDRYLASKEGQDAHERLRKPPISERAVKARAIREGRFHPRGTEEAPHGNSGTIKQGPESEGNQDSLSSRGDDQGSTYD
jgi:hypothetical protein